ncbi:MAG: RIP metalloprotease RseP [Candidatus Latescibacterota bacterium]|nr:MAG: RIP metalloprotease RseP [Candidatus Latescibacterota bacterium]
MTQVWAFLFVLGVLIFVHEFGHFLAAKLVGIRVERFSLGFPPKMVGFRIGETEYCISWIPLGGYVKLAGQADLGPEERTGAPWEFGSKPLKIRTAVVLAGPLMNLFLALWIFIGIAWIQGVAYYPTVRVGWVRSGSPAERAGLRRGDVLVEVGGRPVRDWREAGKALAGIMSQGGSIRLERGGDTLEVTVPPWDGDFGIEPSVPARVGSVVPGSPAERAGIQPGDVIIAVDGQEVEDWHGMRELVRSRPGMTVPVRWRRDDQFLEAEVTLEAREEDGHSVGKLGVVMGLPWRKVGVLEGIGTGARNTYAVLKGTLEFLGGLFTGKVSTKLLGGPVMIAHMAGQQARAGLASLLLFMAVLSVNLAVLNVLPIPVLDGGHLMFLAVEGILGRPLSARGRAVLQYIGMAFLVFLMIYVTINDLYRLF